MGVLTLDNLLTEAGDDLLLERGDALVLETAHKGFEVADFWPNWETKPLEAFERAGTVLDNVTGLPAVKPRADQPRQSLDFTFRFVTRAELARFRRFVEQVRGRQQPFWIPTWERDLEPVNNIFGTDITIESIGYAGTLHPFHARRHAALVKWDRTAVLFGINDATDDGTTEVLNTDTAFGASPGFNKGHVMISFLLLVRLETDEVRYSYVSPTHMTARIRVVELPLEAPVQFT